MFARISNAAHLISWPCPSMVFWTDSAEQEGVICPGDGANWNESDAPLSQGWSEEQILKNDPGLTHEKVQACLAYASANIPAPVPDALVSRGHDAKLSRTNDSSYYSSPSA